MIKVFAFDVFNTIFSLDDVPRQEIKDYARHIKLPEWQPLILPKSWETLPARPDCKEGLDLLRGKFVVVTCSNGPVEMLRKLSQHNNIEWDGYIPIEANKVFKPNPKAYMTICEYCNVQPHEVAMVTANETFGDLEASAALGMTPILIRGGSQYKDVIDLADAYI
jgi:HAD superfamily hydrolase (TIGR01493 family)